MAPPGRSARAGTTASPTSTVPFKPSKPNTRSSQPTLSDFTDAQAQDQEIKDAKTGWNFLLDKGFTEVNEPTTPDTLSHALLRASQFKGLPAVPRSALRAAAFIIQDLALAAQADNIISKLSPRLENSVVSALAPQMAKILHVSGNLEKLDASLHATQDRINESTKAIASQQMCTNDASITPHLVEDLTSIKDAITDLKDIISSTGPPSPPAHSPYRNALLSQQKTTDSGNCTSDTARASAARKERQLLVDMAPDHPVSKDILSRTELITLFQKAITSLKEDGAPDLQLKSLSILRNKGILLELPSKQAASWLREGDRLQRLATATGGDLLFKDRSYNIIVPFIPTATIIEETETLRAIERENELQPGSIAAARWIKPARRREAGQRVAHALFRLATPEVANKLISKGMYINLERFRPAKDKKEPLRCLKCQRWGHMAKECKEQHDTCGTCAKNHRTNGCPSHNTVYCISCDSDNHASWSRTCPEFKRRCQALDENTPENCMPYFPTDEPWTHSYLPSKSHGQLAPTRPPSRNKGNAPNKTNIQKPLDSYFPSQRPPPPPQASNPTPVPTETSNHTAPQNTNAPQSQPQQQPAGSDLGHTSGEPPSSQERATSRPTTPTTHTPAPFPPISPLDNPPPMPTPPPYLTATTSEDTIPSPTPSQ